MWFVGELETVPWWAGAVRRRGLGVDLAPIPLNLFLSWTIALRDAVRWYWTAPGVRFRENRRALRAAGERGRKAGYNQGKAVAMMESRKLVAQGVDEFIEGMLNRTRNDGTDAERGP